MNSLKLLLRGIREVGWRPTLDSALHILRTRWFEAKFADPEQPLRGPRLLRAFVQRIPIPPDDFPPAGPTVRTPGTLRKHEHREGSLVFTFDHATLTLTVLAPDAIHLSWRPLPVSLSPAPLVPLSPCPFDLEETPTTLLLHTGRMTCAISRSDGQVEWCDAEGHPFVQESAPIGWTADGRALCHWAIPADAHFYGLGQRTVGLDLRGGSYVNWNTDPRTYTTGDDPVDLCIPFLLGLHDGGQQGYGLLLENTARSRFDLGQSDPTTMTIEVEDTVASYTFFYGPNLADVLERASEQTGRHPLFPRWTLGYHQCRWSYFPDERVRRLARDFRQTHQVPCDGIHLDIHYMDGYRCFTWDEKRFPDPVGLIDELHAQGFKVVTIVDPAIKADRRYRVFQDGLAQDVFCRYPDGRLFVGPVWPGNCAFPDFTDPRVRDWWGDLYGELVKTGVDGFWNDMNEPAVFGEAGATIPAPIRHALDGAGGDHRRAHNIYSREMVRATAAGLARLRPGQRPFVFTRSGWTGVQRYGFHWTGDNQSTWESLRLTTPMVLGLGLSGIAVTGADVGGFNGFASGELFCRWLQLGAFQPFFRAHTIFHSPDQEPWSWGEPYLSINRETIRLRYRLLPYLYTAFWQSTQSGVPMARPLFLAFQEDPITFTLADEFLCGDALLVAPVLEEGATSRMVYLPAGTWFDFWSKARYEGPEWIEVAAPLERIPLFVRSGSALPLGPAVDYAKQQEGCPLEIHLFPGTGVSQLYEDDGESLAYQQGGYRLTTLALTASPRTLRLTRRVEGEFDPGYDGFAVVVHGVDGPPLGGMGMTNAAIDYEPQQRAAWITAKAFTELQLEWPA